MAKKKDFGTQRRTFPVIHSLCVHDKYYVLEESSKLLLALKKAVTLVLPLADFSIMLGGC